jgi:predicted lipoprotein with Yx(FWY)xxD motif
MMRAAAALFFLIIATGGASDGVAAPVVASPLVDADFSEGPPPTGLAVGRADSVGPIYVTASGMTLYVNGLDAPNGVFGCTDARYDKTGGSDGYPLPRASSRRTCLEKWTPFVAMPDAVANGPWSIVVRPDGRRQWAYEDQPLYFSPRDKRPGDVNGTMGMARYGAWRVLPVPLRLPSGTRLIRKVEGLMLASSEDGRLLLTPSTSRSSLVPGLVPMYAPEIAVGSDVVVRRDGRKQWAFRGAPLYRVTGDSSGSLVQSLVASKSWRPLLIQPASPRPKFLTMHMSVPEIGWVFADSRGRTLYAMYCHDQVPDRLSCDEVGDPAAHWSALCGDAKACAREWQPVLADVDAVSMGAWAVTDVPYPQFVEPTGAYGEGVPTVRAWTYFGRPVYTFVADETPGDVQGHGIEAKVSGFGAITVLADEFPVLP